MRLTDASMVIQPRNPWEAIDLGVLLARQHLGLLMSSWAVVSLPVFLLLSLLLWQSPTWSILLLWWLKPAFDRLPLYILSRALFGDTPSLRQALGAFPALLKPQLLASLTWRRCSPRRSFILPVQQLEGLTGEARQQRLAVLMMGNNGAASILTLIGMAVEATLVIGLSTLFYFFIPQQLEIAWDWQDLISGANGQWLWLEHLTNLFYALLLIFWEPIYIACGFSLYLNRRTLLEGWDIELSFRCLRQRLGASAYALLLGCAMLLSQAPLSAFAANPADPLSPDAARLLSQPLNSQQARRDVQQLLDEAPFENRKTITRWNLPEEPADSPEKKPDTGNGIWKLLHDLLSDNWLINKLPVALEAMLWATLIGLLVLLAWRYRAWLGAFGKRLEHQSRRKTPSPEQLFGLEVTPQSLPDDVAAKVESLWTDNPRAALSLLYRALLSRLIHDHGLPLKSADTEAQVLHKLHSLNNVQLYSFSKTLTWHWQNLAYGHRQPPEDACQTLCDTWRSLLGQEQRR